MDLDGVRAEPIYRSIANSQGIDDHMLRRMCANRELQRLRHGAYVDPAALREMYPEDRHRIRLEATARALRRPAVISHVSAAVMHGLPLWGVDLRRGHFTREQSSSSFTTKWLRVHAASLTEDEIVMVDGFRVTSVARTVVDLARSESFEQSVVSGDGALNCGRVTRADLDEVLSRTRAKWGFPAATRAVSFMDGRSESAGESRSRVIMSSLGLPEPDLQRVLRRRDRHLGRVDFCLESHGVVGEFDGLGKYERGRRPGETVGNVVAREKAREDAIRQSGAVVVRWIWSELDTPRVIRARFEEAFAVTRLLPPPDWDAPRPEDAYAPRPR